MSLGIYVHIPFCKSKCKYCDFNSSAKNWGLEEAYTEALIGEINACPFTDKVDSVFFGGGTPTAIKTENLVKIIGEVKNKFALENAEFTVECNPATMGYDGFLKLRKSGVNRLSIGLQSANDDELAHLGRIHTFDMFLHTFYEARKAGFDNINVDLMFSLHNQTEEKWSNTLKKVTELKPEHISCYSLIVEEGTPFYDMDLNLPDEEADRKMYYIAVDFLAGLGYEQYEISNFALKNKECRHNIKYWKRDNYIGFGCGASSLYDNVRMENSYDICDYIKYNKINKNHLSKDDSMAEHIFLGLRMTEGFDIGEFNKIYSVDFVEKYQKTIDKFVDAGLLEVGKNCRLTEEGISVSNSVMCEFV